MPRIASLGGVLAPPSFIVALTVATLVTPGYSHLRQTISELAGPGTPHPEVLQAGFVVYDVLVLGLTFAVFTHLRGRRGGLVLPVLLVAYSLGGILAGLLRDDFLNPALLGLTIDDLHTIAATATYAVILATTLVGAWAFGGEPGWRGFAAFSIAMAVLTGLFGLLFELHDSDVLHGVYQRGFFVTTMLWVEVLSLRLLLLPRAALDGVARPQ